MKRAHLLVLASGKNSGFQIHCILCVFVDVFSAELEGGWLGLNSLFSSVVNDPKFFPN